MAQTDSAAGEIRSARRADRRMVRVRGICPAPHSAPPSAAAVPVPAQGTMRDALPGRYDATHCEVLWDTEMRCSTSPGGGGPHALQVLDVGGQDSSPSVATLSYGHPVIVRFEGPGRASSSAAGGEILTIVGSNFGPDETTLDAVTCRDVVSGEEFGAQDCTMTVPHRALECFTPSGPAGTGLTWTVTVGGLGSKSPSTSTARPHVGAVELVGVDVASTSGGDRVRLSGTDFGVRDDRISAVTFGVTGLECVVAPCAGSLPRPCGHLARGHPPPDAGLRPSPAKLSI